MNDDSLKKDVRKRERKEVSPFWDVRKTIAELHGLEAASRYDEYLKEHKFKLNQLMQIAGYKGNDE